MNLLQQKLMNAQPTLVSQAKMANTQQLRVFLQLFSTLCLCVVLTQIAHAEGSGKIVKWKDEKGVTHYGDKLPSQAAGRSNSEMNKSGSVIKKNNAYDAKTNSIEIESAASTLAKKDSALLASYSNIDEIDIARDRNIKSDELAVINLNQRNIDARAQLKIKQDKANSFIKRKKPIPEFIANDIKLYETKIVKTDAEIATAEGNIAITKARFASYKARYAELKPNNDNAPVVLERKKALADLNNQKVAANAKLNNFLKQAREAKQAGKDQPQNVSFGIQETYDEIAHLDTQIIATQAKLNEGK